MPTFVVCCSQGASSSAILVRDALAGSVEVEIAPQGVDVFQDLSDGRCAGVVLPLEEARKEARRRGGPCQVISRGERRDVLLSERASSTTLGDLTPASRVGVMGERRDALLRAFRPDLEAVSLGEDLSSAVDRLSSGDLSALIASGAEVIEAGAEGLVKEWLEQTSWVPRAGGGALGLLLPPHTGPILVSPDIAAAVAAEEAVLSGLAEEDIGYLGALALPYGPHLRLWGLVVSADGTRAVRVDLTGSVGQAKELGTRVAEALIMRGAGLTGNGGSS
jgi:hydroxymethylbilane synthase